MVCGTVLNPGINTIIKIMWVEFVVGCLLCPELFFSRFSAFPLSPKTIIFKFQFDQERQMKNHSVDGNRKFAKCPKAGA